MRALLIVTGVRSIPGTGRPTGAYASEVAESWAGLTDAGFLVDLACTAAGPVTLEAYDPGAPAQAALLADARIAAQLADAPSVAAAEAGEADVLVLIGGHGAAWDLPSDAAVAGAVADVDRSGGVLAAVCHGAAGLLGARRDDGASIIAGRRVAAFTDAEERAVGMLSSVPFLLSSELAHRGAIHEPGPPFLPLVVVDGRLVTGQNPASTPGVVRAAAELALRGRCSGASRAS